ncbi:MAG: response regulator transcription factor [Nitrospirae bacterium]|nr:response regulator transcription factor [Candidatus Manganitrophaceae bacterium]
MNKKKRTLVEESPLLIKPRALTKRETEVVELVARGYKNREVAKKLGVAVKTVETHRANVMNKLALRNIAQLIRYAIQKGIVSTDFE